MEFDSPIIESIFATKPLPQDVMVSEAENEELPFVYGAEEMETTRKEKMRNIYSVEDEDVSLDAEEVGRIKKVGLVKGRHQLPVEEFVFEEIVQNNGFAELILTGLSAEARHWINRNLAGVDKLELYVTGFTPALTAFLVEWNKLDPECELILLHYDNETQDYVGQVYEAESDLIFNAHTEGQWRDLIKRIKEGELPIDRKKYVRYSNLDMINKQMLEYYFKRGRTPSKRNECVKGILEEMLKGSNTRYEIEDRSKSQQTELKGHYSSESFDADEQLQLNTLKGGLEVYKEDMQNAENKSQKSYFQGMVASFDNVIRGLERHGLETTIEEIMGVLIPTALQNFETLEAAEMRNDTYYYNAGKIAGYEEAADFLSPFGVDFMVGLSAEDKEQNVSQPQYFDSEMKNLLDSYVEKMYPTSVDAQAKLMNAILSGKKEISIEEMKRVVDSDSEWPVWEEDYSPEDEDIYKNIEWESETGKPKTTTLAALLGLGALAAAIAPREIRELFKRLGR